MNKEKFRKLGISFYSFHHVFVAEFYYLKKKKKINEYQISMKHQNRNEKLTSMKSAQSK